MKPPATASDYSGEAGAERTEDADMDEADPPLPSSPPPITDAMVRPPRCIFDVGNDFQ